MITKSGSCGRWVQGNLGNVADGVDGNLTQGHKATEESISAWRKTEKI